MKKLLVLVSAVALAATASASIDPTRPMVTGRGNVRVAPAKVIVTHQTAATAPAADSDTVTLDKFTVTGSLLPHAKAAPRRR